MIYKIQKDYMKDNIKKNLISYVKDFKTINELIDNILICDDLINNLTDNINRVEVIDHQTVPLIGRAYTKYNCKNVDISLQDDFRTLKIFINDKKE